MKRQVYDLLAKGWVHQSVLYHGAPVLFFRKKTGELRMCIDFSCSNFNTRLDAFPLPRIVDLLDKLGKAWYSSSIDLASAYH